LTIAAFLYLSFPEVAKAGAWVIEPGQWQTNTSLLLKQPSSTKFAATVEGKVYAFNINTSREKIITNEIIYGIYDNINVSWKAELNTKRLEIDFYADTKNSPLNWHAHRNVAAISNVISIKKQLLTRGDDLLTTEISWDIPHSVSLSLLNGRALQIDHKRHGYLDIEFGIIGYRHKNFGGFLNIMLGWDLNDKLQANLGVRHKIRFRSTHGLVPKDIKSLIAIQTARYQIPTNLASIIQYDLQQATNILNWPYNQHLVQLGLAMSMPKDKKIYLDLLLPINCMPRKQQMLKLTLEKKL
jgi:hypothetical protein